MEKSEIKKFFDSAAPTWDAEMIRNEEAISLILEHSGIKSGSSVLDVACGTGVLVSDYLQKGAGSVLGVDISPAMIARAEKKFSRDGRVRFLCGDIETAVIPELFDVGMVYNAFPHFPDPENLIRVLSGLIRPGGTLSIAHGQSRESIDRHHSGRAGSVSIRLMPAKELKELMSPYFDVNCVISDDKMYDVSGIRK